MFTFFKNSFTVDVLSIIEENNNATRPTIRREVKKPRDKNASKGAKEIAWG